jgi:TRAP-type transport system periplasmic protein
MKSLGYTPVPLETSDILPAMQTGMINVPCRPRPTSRWPARSTTPPPHAGDQLGAHRRCAGGHAEGLGRDESGRPEGGPGSGLQAGDKMRVQARKEVDEAVEAMKKRGLIVTTPNAEQMKAWRELADKLYPQIRGKLVPADTFDEVVGHLESYRAGKGK